MATTYDKASLVMIPSGYKDDKLYSVKPTDGSGDFTFSRDGAGASPATRVNASGLIEKGRENVLLQSNQFDTTWLPSSAISVTGGQSGYDGSSDAWLLKRSDAGARYLSQNITLSNGVYSFSVYAKAESEEWIFLWTYNGSASKNAYFHLTGAGAVGSFISADGATIESVGGGWYRCTIFYSDPVQSVRIYPAVADGSITGGITDAGIYIQDAQLEQGLVATDYIETTTAAVSAGLLGDMPRLDYSGGATCPSLLLEPSRVNQLEHSEYFGNATTANATIESNQAVSPEGVNNATKLVDNSTTGSHYFRTSNVSTANTTIRTFTGYFKQGSLPAVQVRMANAAGTFSYYYVDVDLTDGSVLLVQAYQVANTSNNVEYFGDGWYKVTITASFTDAAVNLSRVEIFTHNGTSHSYTGDGTGYIYLYGLQKELGSYPTSYIPTYGSASTRAADVAVKTSASSLINSEEGVVFVDITLNGLTDYGTPLSLTDGSTSNYVWLTIFGNGDLRAELYNGAAQASITYNGATIGNRYKMAFAYSANDFVFYVNGTQVGTDTSGTTFSANTLTRIDTYLTNATNYSKSAYVNNQTLLFKTRLTNAELAALTTI